MFPIWHNISISARLSVHKETQRCPVPTSVSNNHYLYCYWFVPELLANAIGKEIRSIKLKRRESLITCRKLALILENSTWFVKKWLQAIKNKRTELYLNIYIYISHTHTHLHTQSCIGRKKMIFRDILKDKNIDMSIIRILKLYMKKITFKLLMTTKDRKASQVLEASAPFANL